MDIQITMRIHDMDVGACEEELIVASSYKGYLNKSTMVHGHIVIGT